MKKIYFFSVLSLLFLTTSAFADFSLYWRDQNYFLYESSAYSRLDLDSGNNPAGPNNGNNRVFSTFKLRMKPSLSITDRLTLHSMFDAFVSPNTTKSQEEGALQGQQATDTNVYGPSVNANLPRTFFGDGTTGAPYGRSASTSGDSNFLIRTAYLEYLGDWGIFKLGRMPRHWGLGMRYNEGANSTDKFRDRTDSIFYELGLGNFKGALIYSKIAENTIDSKKDDANLYESYIHWNDPEKDFDLGFLYSFFKQTQNFIDLHTLDGYVIKKTPKWKTGLEIVVTRGSPGVVKGNDTKQLGAASEFEYTWTESLSNYVKLGYASGQNLSSTGTLQLFAFNRNYDIALIMFNQGLGSIPTLTGVSSTSDPDINTIFDAYYLNLGSNYNFNDRIGSNLNYTVARAPVALTSGGKKDYGQEVDLGLWYQFLANLKLRADTGIFFPGGLYDGQPASGLNQSTDYSYAGVLSATLLF